MTTPSTARPIAPARAWLSAVTAVLVWLVHTATAWVAIPRCLGIFKQFDAKMPFFTEIYLAYWPALGVLSTLLAIGVLVKECLPIGLPRRISISRAMLITGLLAVALAWTALLLPLIAIAQSLMGPPPP